MQTKQKFTRLAGIFILAVVFGVFSVSQAASAKSNNGSSHRLSARERAAQAKLNRTTRTATVPKTHNRTIPGKVANIDYTNKTFDLIKGHKTYKVDASATGVMFVNRKWQPLTGGINDIQNGHKVTVKGAVTGLNVAAKWVRDVNLPVETTSTTE